MEFGWHGRYFAHSLCYILQRRRTYLCTLSREEEDFDGYLNQSIRLGCALCRHFAFNDFELLLQTDRWIVS